EIKDDNGTEELIMVLKPENLGQVAVKLVKENGAISVMLSAQYDEVGKMMTERAASLGSSLSNNNVEVKSVEVVNPSNAAEQMGLAFTNQGFSFAQNFNRGQEYSPERRGGYDDLDEIEGVDVIDATDNIELIREARLWTTA
ncbi:MAG: flagellar hook-length control protein FliK, partial [Oscillospiraceae bacterium]|nr:flagellar hook-length control protein FliK [Oscillospiraceae bacterium]